MGFDPSLVPEDEEEQALLDKYNERFKPVAYRPVFYPPSQKWRVDGLFPEDFFHASELLLERIVIGRLNEGIGGIAAVFLSRHYLELMLKYTLFHSRWLKDDRSNAAFQEIESVGRGHTLTQWWTRLKNELNRLPLTVPRGLDLQFVEMFVADFHRIDPINERFRYPGDKLPVSHAADVGILGIEFDTLLFNLRRVKEIMETLDNELIEQHGLNEDWKEQMP